MVVRSMAPPASIITSEKTDEVQRLPAWLNFSKTTTLAPAVPPQRALQARAAATACARMVVLLERDRDMGRLLVFWPRLVWGGVGWGAATTSHRAGRADLPRMEMNGPGSR